MGDIIPESRKKANTSGFEYFGPNEKNQTSVTPVPEIPIQGLCPNSTRVLQLLWAPRPNPFLLQRVERTNGLDEPMQCRHALRTLYRPRRPCARGDELIRPRPRSLPLDGRVVAELLWALVGAGRGW